MGFSVRNVAQCRRKFANRASFWTTDAHGPGPYVEHAQHEIVAHGAQTFYDSLVVDDEVVARGVRDASLLIDTRLRDTLRLLGAPDRLHPRRRDVPLAHERHVALLAHEVAMLDATEETRLNRRVDELERRVAALEQRTGRRR